MPTRPTTSAATEPVEFDLDALERDGEPAKPFTVRLNDRVYTFLDPQDVDWQDLLGALRDPTTFFQHCLTPEDSKAFLSPTNKVPIWKMGELMQRYKSHFGLPSSGESRASS